MRIPGWLFLLGTVGLVVATIVCSFGAFSLARGVAGDLAQSGVVVSFEQVAQSIPTPTITPTPEPTGLPTLDPALNVTPTITPIPPTPTVTPTLDPMAVYTWDDPRRVNILLVGIDQREGVADEGYYLTDTIIVVSIDPVRKAVSLLSIPRDLWVAIPGFQYGRVNTAYLGRQHR